MSSEGKVIFSVSNRDNRKFEFRMDQKVLDVRDKLCEEFDMKDKFCNIECLLEFPIRKFGILTLDPGEFGDIYDNEKLNRFNIEGKTININIKFEDKKQNKINLKNLKRVKRYKRENKEKKKTFVYNDDDFPPLC